MNSKRPLLCAETIDDATKEGFSNPRKLWNRIRTFLHKPVSTM